MPRRKFHMPASSLGGFVTATVPDRLAADAIQRLHLQTDLPQGFRFPNWSFDVPEIVLWAIVAVALALLLYYTKDLRWWSAAKAELAEERAVRAAAGLDDHRLRAERFAQQGAFVEAMHELLLAALRDMRQRAGTQLAASLTSREILRLGLLPELGRAALRAIVMRVEWTYFGQHAATRADFEECRASLDLLQHALRQAT